MLINPGYAFVKGEKQTVYAERKIKDLRMMIDERGLNTKIELDGRISSKNIEDWGGGLADIFVTGSTCLKRDDLEGSFTALNQIRRNFIS